jgi:hypothetical protein
MLVEVQFSAARNSLKEVFDTVWYRSLPAIVKRRRIEEILLIRRDLQQDILRVYKFKPEVLPEDDGSVTLALDELDLAVNAPTIEEAVEDLVREIKFYAEEYRERPQLFLNTPIRKEHFPYILRAWLCESDQEIKSLLEM